MARLVTERPPARPRRRRRPRLPPRPRHRVQVAVSGEPRPLPLQTAASRESTTPGTGSGGLTVPITGLVLIVLGVLAIVRSSRGSTSPPMP